MKKIFVLVSLIFANFSNAQTKEGAELCFAMQSNNVMSDIKAENALDKILDVIGVSKNFTLIPCDKISNAVATAYKGTRYILYDKNFMSLISQNTNDWSSLFILAHEVGHHINGHSLDILLYASDAVDIPTLEKKRKQELEADEFAAFVLAKLGANLSQLNNVIALISNNTDDTYSTHPKRSKRLLSVRNGFNKGYIKKETKKVIVDRTELRYEKSTKFIKLGDWYRYKSNDPFNQFHLAITNGKVYNSSIKSTDMAPTFVTYGRDGVGFANLKKLYPKESKKLFDSNINHKQISGPVVGKLNMKIIIYQNDKIIYDETRKLYFAEASNNYDNRANAARALGDDLMRIYGSNHLLRYYLKEGTKLLVKFIKVFEVQNTEVKRWTYDGENVVRYITEHREATNMHKDTYFEYSLSGSSKAIAD